MRAQRIHRRRQRRGSRRLWPLLGVAAVGVLAIAVATRWERRERRKLQPGRRRTHLPEERQPSPSEPGRGFGGIPEAPEVPGTAESTQVWIAGPAGNLFVRDGGSVPGAHAGLRPVLFVHGLAGNGGQWALQLDHLRRRRRALALDLRGHGDSDPADDGSYDVPALARDVAAVADHFALRRLFLVGHSLGASVAIEYAGLHPERVAGLLLVDPNGDQTRLPRSAVEPFLAALSADPLHELASYYRQLLVGGDRDAAQWVLEDLRLTDEEAILRAVEASVRYSPLPALARYQGPRLAVISDLNDLPYSLHNLLPALPVQLLRGTGHWLMMDRPEPFNHLLEEFLAAAEGAG
ncbi:MAG TPA: alpha/beta fold hydrolase [Thermoanaerobaculia bacterium]|nr:alpha/beta fold hydrolase [Thermoanaerobaculia bacterium]